MMMSMDEASQVASSLPVLSSDPIRDLQKWATPRNPRRDGPYVTGIIHTVVPNLVHSLSDDVLLSASDELDTRLMAKYGLAQPQCLEQPESEVDACCAVWNPPSMAADCREIEPARA